MNGQTYTNQEITEYLLGSLPVAKAELFDELSITDESFAAALDAAENELLDEYARGELGGATLDKFKSHYLASPLRGDKAVFAETFQFYGKQNAGERSEEAKNFVSAEEKPEKMSGGFFSFLNILRNPHSRLQFGFACAGLLALLAGGFWLFSNLSNDQNTETARTNQPVFTPQPTKSSEETPSAVPAEANAANSANLETPLPPEKEPIKKPAAVQPTRTPAPEKTIAPPKISVTAFILAPSLRGGNQVRSLSIPAAATDVKMKLELETDDFPAYRVALTDETGGVNLWRSGKIKAAANGENKFLNIRFPAKLLKSKIYMLAASGINAGGEEEVIGNYVFRSVLK